MENLNQPTFQNGRYRLDRLVVAHDDVTIWKATDLARGIAVQLSIFERGSTVLHQGKSEDGMFVAIDSSPRSARLELVDDADGFFPEPREPEARRRAWPWAVAGLACALTALAGWYVAAGRAHPVASETTITAAEIPAVVETAAKPPAPIVTTAAPTVAPPVEAPIITKPVAAPERHETPAPRAKPQLPKPAKPRTPSPAATSYDPLTI